MKHIIKDINPRISLVGAGPGDPELITLKAIKAIQSADVILFDALIADELLEYAPHHCLKIYVGKRSGKHSYQQNTINKMLVTYALDYGHVVRLKGGDPFVFGRGYEEIEEASKNGIPVKIIPGISSAIAVPALQSIPLTHRNFSDNFQVVTATKSTGELADSVHQAAHSNGTVVVLMGFKKLDQILAIYAMQGKSDLPIALIENGSTDEERLFLGRVSDISSKIKNENIAGPVLIVLGEVVSLHPKFNQLIYSNAVLY